jgi:hypothetical protein
MLLAERRPDWKVRREKLADADLFAFVLKRDRGEAWYFTQGQLKEPFVRLYNKEWAVTFYRTNAPKGRVTDSDVARFKGTDGLQRFIDGVRKPGKSVVGKAARRN